MPRERICDKPADIEEEESHCHQQSMPYIKSQHKDYLEQLRNIVWKKWSQLERRNMPEGCVGCAGQKGRG